MDIDDFLFILSSKEIKLNKANKQTKPFSNLFVFHTLKIFLFYIKTAFSKLYSVVHWF